MFDWRPMHELARRGRFPGGTIRQAGGPRDKGDELAEFLRRVAKRRAAQASQQQQEVVIIPPQTPAPAPPRRLVEEVVEEVHVIEEEPTGADVAAHVSRHLNTAEYEARAQRLGERAGQADDDMESHLRQVFEHRVGKLPSMESRSVPLSERSAASTASVEGITPAAEIAGTLRHPQTIRQAIILSEILGRPDHRW
jgi:hypothetical protein